MSELERLKQDVIAEARALVAAGVLPDKYGSIIKVLVEQLDRERAAGEAAMKARIVAWLRRDDTYLFGDCTCDYADAIEAGACDEVTP